jgi:S-adenosylmethionine hydrolase
MPEPRLPIITLTTDFGGADHYVGALKAAILSVSTQIAIVDISHEIPAHDVLEAGWVLLNAFSAFPSRTVHVAVADPGVGTSRRPIVAVAQDHLFVGPDNGIFSFIWEVEPPWQVYHITATHYMRSPVSDTFHARDIFGPVAAHLARGADASNVGDPIEDYMRLDLPRPRVMQEGVVKAFVAHVDRFGNVVLNVTQSSMEALLEKTQAAGFVAASGSTRITQRLRAYGEAPAGTPFLLYNSSGFLEIAANQSRASELLKVRRGDVIDVILVQQAAQ